MPPNAAAKLAEWLAIEATAAAPRSPTGSAAERQKGPHHGKAPKLLLQGLSSISYLSVTVRISGWKDQQAMTEQTTGGALSDYETVGGAPAVSAVVNDFYERVLGDPKLAPYFDGVDLGRLKRHQVLLVTKVLGGPDNYTGRPLDEAHDGLGITHDDFTAVVGHLAAAMKDAGVPDDIIGRAGAAVAATEPDIVEAG
jgi:hemoglobin